MELRHSQVTLFIPKSKKINIKIKLGTNRTMEIINSIRYNLNLYSNQHNNRKIVLECKMNGPSLNILQVTFER